MEVQTVQTVDPGIAAPDVSEAGPAAPTAAASVSALSRPVEPAADAVKAPSQSPAPTENVSLLASVGRTIAGAPVSVSYHVDIREHKVITVFTDTSNGKVLFQLPAEVLSQLASFFDQHSGAVVDRKA